MSYSAVHTEAISSSFNTSDLELVSRIFARSALVREKEVHAGEVRGDANDDDDDDDHDDHDHDYHDDHDNNSSDGGDEMFSAEQDYAIPAAPVSSVSSFSFDSTVVWTFDIQFGALKIVVINDFDGSNIPLLRLAVEECGVNASGMISSLQGTFTSCHEIDFYNVVAR
jgi:hypothetical protein